MSYLVEKCETSVWKKSENTTTVDKILIKIAFVLPPLSSINCGKIPLYYVTVREQIVGEKYEIRLLEKSENLILVHS